jgi:hypothetical protein
VKDDIKIRIDRDKTNALPGHKEELLGHLRGQYASDAKSSIVAEFVSNVSMFRIVDEREVRDILRTGIVSGGSFATPGERRYGASWAGDPDGLVAWGRGWQRHRGHAPRLGKNLFLLELPDAAGKTFYHMAILTSPRFDPFGPSEQIARMNVSDCSTGLGCSIMKVWAREVYFFRVKPDGKTVPVEAVDLEKRAQKMPHKAIDLTPVNPGIYYTGWIHGRSVIVVLDQTRKNRYGELTRLWDVVVRRQNHEEPIVIGKKSRKAAIDDAVAILEIESFGDR